MTITSQMLGNDTASGLTRLGLAGEELRVPLRAEPPGEALRLRVRARDVSVAVTEPKGLSVQNILPAAIESVEGAGAHEVMLRLRLGEAALLSRVTAEAASRLALRPGLAVWALVKSAAFGPEDEGG